MLIGMNAMGLTLDQIQFYKENGYLVVENVVPETELARLRTIIEEFKMRSRGVAASDEVFDVGPNHSANAPKLRRIKHPVDQHREFDALMRSEKIVDMVADLLGGTVRFDHSKLNFKPTGSVAKVAWHQDWAFYPHTNEDLLAIGVMIEDCTSENGPLKVIPGSHLGPVYDHHLDGMFTGGVQLSDLGAEADKAIELTAKAGSISIHHVRMLHASSENSSGAERPLLLYSYSAVDAVPVFETRDLAEYDSRILRGSPTLAPRMTDVPIRLQYPKQRGADSIFDNQAPMLDAG
jgi:phytanoyl-CoA hydroxylase